ncbi:hypothetical protein [Congregibacter litoralis]|uniref:Kazal-like domain-containing protein n=1 Tax=Congregibacter litoralis KT71 TaxID=314285 RepID=A4A6P2_9GAMM|nr:hypothetical protein [Congregibacter litoralis]EAQ98689.1 hypothetical protein KT71_01890 [Congregibacter litoralis KT71]
MRFSLLISALTLAAVGAVSGCATPVEPEIPNFTTCKEPRPQVCTMIFAPVCATTVSGGLATHASGCNACADDQVLTYVDGACEEGGDSL